MAHDDPRHRSRGRRIGVPAVPLAAEIDAYRIAGADIGAKDLVVSGKYGGDMVVRHHEVIGDQEATAVFLEFCARGILDSRRRAADGFETRMGGRFVEVGPERSLDMFGQVIQHRGCRLHEYRKQDHLFGFAQFLALLQSLVQPFDPIGIEPALFEHPGRDNLGKWLAGEPPQRLGLDRNRAARTGRKILHDRLLLRNYRKNL